jgi:hypothetical protein
MANDTFQLTDWFDGAVDPTIPGPYECTTNTAGGYVCQRIWTGATWLSNVTGAPTTVRLPWRGIVPGSVPVVSYPAGTQVSLLAAGCSKIDTRDPNAFAAAA